MSLTLSIDIGAILDLNEKLDPERVKALAEARARQLSAMAHSHLTELVQNSLHSSRQKYLDALSKPTLVDGVWVISLDAAANWIEDGMDRHEMIDDLLKSSKAKTAKDGSRYLAVPFEHKKGPTQQTPQATDLTDAIKAHFKQVGEPWGKLAMAAPGRPLLGKIASYDVATPPKLGEGPGMGWGPIGEPRQGPTGVPFLNQVNVYQKEVKQKDGSTKVQKFVTTFRIVSSKMKGSGRWTHPGLKPRKFFEKTYDWAEKQLEDVIIPSIVAELSQ
jgi:hypothetical protein